MRKEPITISMAFGIEPDKIFAAGAIDVTLNCDTNLFIDPLLLADCADREFSDCSCKAYKERFEQIIEILNGSATAGDYAWRNAERLFEFPEIRFTHLGYLSGKVGSGSGEKIRASLMANCREAIRLGIRNPNLFLVLALFEDKVGADRISDMVTGIALPCLCAFTKMISAVLGIECRRFTIRNQVYDLPANPAAETLEPLLFVPVDIVRDLPMAADWDSVASAARQTDEIRERVSRQIGEIWAAKTRRDKANIRSALLSNAARFKQFLDIFESCDLDSYNVKEDHLGEIYPAAFRQEIANRSPLDLGAYAGRPLIPEEVAEIVEKIVEKFQELIEHNGLWELLYDDDRATPRREKAAQRLFYATASAYCAANGLDLSPEADAGCGPVDFKISQGMQSKVIVEIQKNY